MLLEVCAFTLRSCMIAVEAGADRIELCADPLQGGTTPSFGMIAAAVELGIPIFPMIRPRGGDFHFDKEEIDVIRRDIRVCRELGCPGIVTGVMRADGTLDEEVMKRIVDQAGTMEVTCHKAFDQVPDASAALETVMAAGCARVLTSGLRTHAMEGATTIRALIEQAAGRIVVMPGGGVRSSNIAELRAATAAVEFHSSAITSVSKDHTADRHEVDAMVHALHLLPH